MTRRKHREKDKTDSLIDDDPLWYKDAIIYELHVRSFCDSTGDGLGDFTGLTSKLDYLQDLGVNAIWLMPFFPSPWKDDGYDISDYCNVHPAYGTLRDFRKFLSEAHRRGMRVIIELVLNHTSDQHPWFQRARRAKPGSRYRNYYVWSEKPDKYLDARIIFSDYESSNWAFDQLAGAYYWHRFYSHQPDLNYDNPEVHDAVFQAADFWLDMGIDGFRLDAVPYLYEREGTNCEDLPETHAFLAELRQHIEKKYGARVLLAEANQWPEDAVRYFGQKEESMIEGQNKEAAEQKLTAAPQPIQNPKSKIQNFPECNMVFHFPLMPRLFMAIRMEDRYPIVDILQQTPTISEDAQWALFLRNHDELTLETVTDEERDYMYRAYVRDARARFNLGIRRRLAPLLGNNRRQIELMTSLLFSLPGSPVIYYGDELGLGDNIYLGDRNGVRTPMQWTADRNAGFSNASPQSLYLPVVTESEYHYESLNVESQQNNRHSLLWWNKRLIAMRKLSKVFGRGSLEFLHPDNRKVLAYIRRYQPVGGGEPEIILVIANLSRFVQYVYLDLSAFKDRVPVELFGRTPFPPITQDPYFLTVSPHGFFWFALQPREVINPGAKPAEKPVPQLSVSGPWHSILLPRYKRAFENMILDRLSMMQWFAGKNRLVQGIESIAQIPVSSPSLEVRIVIVRLNYTEGDPDMYALYLAFATGDRAKNLLAHAPASVIALIPQPNEPDPAILYDALWNEDFCRVLYETMTRRRTLETPEGKLVGHNSRAFKQFRPLLGDAAVHSAVLEAQTHNTCVTFRTEPGLILFLFKAFRRIESGINPELEIGLYLTEESPNPVAPPVTGYLEYRGANNDLIILGVLQGYRYNEGDAWQYTLDAIGDYFDRVLVAGQQSLSLPRAGATIAENLKQEIPAEVSTLIGHFLDSAKLLGQRTAEMHLALAAAAAESELAPESFTSYYQRALYHDLLTSINQSLSVLRKRLSIVPENLRDQAQALIGLDQQIKSLLRKIRDTKIDAKRIRIHGHYHLGQVLNTGRDFVILDFEGDPSRPVSERRLKRSPLRDVAGMLRSFHYASRAAFTGQATGLVVRPEDHVLLEPAAELWYGWVHRAFIRGYFQHIPPNNLLPADPALLQAMLDIYTLDKAADEMLFDIPNRPPWLASPIRDMLSILARNKP